MEWSELRSIWHSLYYLLYLTKAFLRSFIAFRYMELVSVGWAFCMIDLGKLMELWSVLCEFTVKWTTILLGWQCDEFRRCQLARLAAAQPRNSGKKNRGLDNLTRVSGGAGSLYGGGCQVRLLQVALGWSGGDPASMFKRPQNCQPGPLCLGTLGSIMFFIKIYLCSWTVCSLLARWRGGGCEWHFGSAGVSRSWGASAYSYSQTTHTFQTVDWSQQGRFPCMFFLRLPVELGLIHVAYFWCGSSHTL